MANTWKTAALVGYFSGDLETLFRHLNFQKCSDTDVLTCFNHFDIKMCFVPQQPPPGAAGHGGAREGRERATTKGAAGASSTARGDETETDRQAISV